jgi:hypothetical protein
MVFVSISSHARSATVSLILGFQYCVKEWKGTGVSKVLPPKLLDSSTSPLDQTYCILSSQGQENRTLGSRCEEAAKR